MVAAQLNSDLATAKQSFQAGVDALYNQCVSCGATPTAKTPAAIAAAIQTIFNSRYNAGVAAAKNFTLQAKVSGIIYNNGEIWSGFHHNAVITCQNGQLSYSTAEQSGGTAPITTKTTLGNVSVSFEV